jgi:uncharacterized protein YbcI
MGTLDQSKAEQIAKAACEFEQQRTGHMPKSVRVILSGDTLVITLHGVLTPAEIALAKHPAGAAQLREFHRQLFQSSVDSLWRKIEAIANVEVREASSEIESSAGAVVHVFTSGAVVQVFVLGESVATETWAGAV